MLTSDDNFSPQSIAWDQNREKCRFFSFHFLTAVSAAVVKKVVRSTEERNGIGIDCWQSFKKPCSPHLNTQSETRGIFFWLRKKFLCKLNKATFLSSLIATIYGINEKEKEEHSAAAAATNVSYLNPRRLLSRLGA